MTPKTEMKHLRACKRRLDEVKLEPPMIELKRRKLTLELIDQMMDLYREEPGDPNWDKFMELFWGKADETAIVLELLTLARVALVYLNLANDVMTFEDKPDGTELPMAPGPDEVPRTGESASSTFTDADNQGFHDVAIEDLPGGPPGRS